METLAAAGRAILALGAAETGGLDTTGAVFPTSGFVVASLGFVAMLAAAVGFATTSSRLRFNPPGPAS